LAHTKAKEDVLEKLFNDRWDPATGTVSNPIVTNDEVVEAIREWNAAHPSERQSSTKNPYNFFKDIIRKEEGANRRWPESIRQRNYTARQITGGNANLKFIPLEPGQPAFRSVVPPLDPSTETHEIESVSLPLTSRLLGRGDEPWLIQVLVRLHVIETHMSLYSARSILQIDHLQMSVKLHGSEVDALFLAIEGLTKGDSREVIVTCEAKSVDEDISDDQVLRQIRAVFDSPIITQEIVIPIVVKAVRPSLVRVIEFEAIQRKDAASTELLAVASEALYEFIPGVPGIGEKKKSKPRKSSR
jgi:hypothetical protein